MTRGNGIKEAILKKLKEVRSEHDYDKSQDFIEEGLLDSFDIVTIVASLDKAFGISIDGTEVIPENFKNLQMLVSLIEKYLK